MSGERPRVAWIDHDECNLLAGDRFLSKKGIDVSFSLNLDDFIEQHGSLENYPCLIYHPGIGEQVRLLEIRDKFPQLKLAIITPSPEDYHVDKSALAILSYRYPNAIEKWIRDNQPQG